MLLTLIFLLISVSHADVSAQRLNIVSDSWTEVRYTESILVGYPEYYPLIIEFRSLGALPRDKQELTNYTGTVFIATYSIYMNISNFEEIYRERSESEWIGTQSIRFEFAITMEQVGNAKSIAIEIMLYPHNNSLYTSNDLYSLNVKLRHEASGEDILKSLAFTIFPLVAVMIYYLLNRRLNNFFFTNVSLLKTFPYLFYYIYIQIKLKLLDFKYFVEFYVSKYKRQLKTSAIILTILILLTAIFYTWRYLLS
jgi:hypothetical protein